MIAREFLLLQWPTAIGAGLIAGTFFCFSSFVMPALASLEPAKGIEAMQRINVTVINPLFMAVLFGTAALYGVVAYSAYRTNSLATSWPWIIAAMLYLIGTIGVTIIGNVPLNEQLATVAPSSEEGLLFWQHYLKAWTNWNSLRGLAATMAMATSILALALQH